jgi:6-phosphogluconolactonase
MVRPLALFVSLVALMVGAGSALAAYPGRNGVVAWDVLQDFTWVGTSGFAGVQTPASTIASCENSSGPAACVFGAPSYSPDGTTVVFSRRERTARGAVGSGVLTLAASNGAGARTLRRQTRDDEHPAFLPTGRRFVFDGRSGRVVNLFTVSTNGTALRQLTFGGGSTPAPCANGAIAFVRGANIYLLNRNGRSVDRITFRGGTAPNCSPDSRRIAFVRGGDLYTIATDRRHLVRLISGARAVSTSGTVMPGSGDVLSPSFSPDGQQIAFLDAYDTPRGSDFGLDVVNRTGRLFGPTAGIAGNEFTDTEAFDGSAEGVSWQPLKRSVKILAVKRIKGSPFASGIKSAPNSVAFSPDERLLAVGNGDGTVSVFTVDPSTRGLAPVSGSPFTTNGRAATSVAFSPNGNLLAAASSDGKASLFGVDPSTGRLTPVSNAPVATGSLAFVEVTFSPSGALLAIANSAGSVTMFSVDAATRALTPAPGSPFSVGPTGRVVDLAFSRDGALLATADLATSSNVSVFSATPSTGALTEVSGSPFSVHAGGGDISRVAFTTRGLLATTTSVQFREPTSVVSIDPVTGVVAHLPGVPFAPLTGGAYSSDLDPSGALLAIGGGDGVMSVVSLDPSVDVSSPVLSFATGTNTVPRTIAFSPNGRLLATGNYGSVSVFSLAPAR